MLLDADLFHGQIAPALAESWRRRSFEPCQAICRALLPRARELAERYHVGAQQPLLVRAAAGLSFDRDFWTLLAGELFLFGAAEVPELQTAPDTLCCLLAPQTYIAGELPREQFVPIQQAHHGTRDLVFGGRYYCPRNAGLNDLSDVRRLKQYLEAIDPAHWNVTDLGPLRDVADADDLADELEFAREWFPVLQALYRRAAEQRHVVLIETLAPAGGY
jgi:hypothetical protein